MGQKQQDKNRNRSAKDFALEFSSPPTLQKLAEFDLRSGRLTKKARKKYSMAELHLFMGRAEGGPVEDALAKYISQLRNLDPLDSDMQQQLALKYHETQDECAAQLLVLSNLRLVVKLAKDYHRKPLDLLELIQEGNLGLSEAIIRFDPYRKVKFISYAQYWIRAMIMNHLMNQRYSVKFGNTRAGRKLFYNLRKARHELSQRGIIKPTPEELGEYLGVRASEVSLISAQMDAPPVAIDAPAPGYDGVVTNGDLMSDDIEPPDLYAERRQFAVALSEAFDAFGKLLTDPRECSIWYDRMLSNNSLTLKELGEKWGVSKERIRQIESDIRESFKDFILKKFGRSFADDIRDWVN